MFYYKEGSVGSFAVLVVGAGVLGAGVLGVTGGVFGELLKFCTTGLVSVVGFVVTVCVGLLFVGAAACIGVLLLQIDW